MKEELFANPLFSISLTILAYAIGIFINKKTKLALANPLLIAFLLIIFTLKLFNIPYYVYNIGGNMINMFLVPVTALLSVSIYRERARIKKYFLPIIFGSLAGSVISVLSIIALAKLFGLSSELTHSLEPKSVTTPIAISISESLGGISAITICAVMITGILGNVLSPLLCRILSLKSSISKGIAIGTASHALGTSKALEMGEEIGAVSGIALSFSGLITVAISLFL